MRKHEGNQPTRQAFSIARKGVDGFRSEFAGGRQLTEQIRHLPKMTVENLPEFPLARCRKQRADFALVHFPQRLEFFERPVFFSRRGLFAHGQKLLRRLTHGRNDHNGFLGERASHDSRNAFDGGGGLHRRAAKFHHDHAQVT